MAVVDFSKAKVEMYSTGEGQSPFRTANINMGANFYKTFNDKDERTKATVINEGATFTQFLNAGFETYMFSGAFKDSGTSFVIMNNNTYQGWKVSNIRFNDNDTYVFAICIKVPNA